MLCVALRPDFGESEQMLRVTAFVLMVFMPLLASAQQAEIAKVGVIPPLTQGGIPRTRWDHKPKAELWTRSALAALESHGTTLTQGVPRDIDQWCPAYPTAPDRARKAFWVGFLSALAKHESTYRAEAVGGGGRWFGLLQIVPATARGYNCRAQTGKALKAGAENLSCGIRIMAQTVSRDGVIARGFRGVAADWGPLRNARKRGDMMAWTSKQSYCRPMAATRPKLRPEGFEAMAARVAAIAGDPLAQYAGTRPKQRPAIVAQDNWGTGAAPVPESFIRPRVRPQRVVQSVTVE